MRDRLADFLGRSFGTHALVAKTLANVDISAGSRNRKVATGFAVFLIGEQDGFRSFRRFLAKFFEAWILAERIPHRIEAEIGPVKSRRHFEQMRQGSDR